MTTADTEPITTDMTDPELVKGHLAGRPATQDAGVADAPDGDTDAVAEANGDSSAPWPSPEHPPVGEDLVLRWRRIDGDGVGWRRWLRPRNLLKLVATLVVALVIAGLAYVAIHDRSINDARHSALAAAKADGKLLGTFRYQHINQDLKAMEDNSTAAFGKQYKSAQSNLTKLLTQYKANSIGSVSQAAVQSVSSNKATVLLFLNQAVTNSAVGAQPKSEPSRVVMTLVKHGSKWLVSNVQVI